MRFNNKEFYFRPSLLGVLITLICIPLFIHFGLWQYGKANIQKDRQSAYLKSDQVEPEAFPIGLNALSDDAQARWNYSKVRMVGEYHPQYAFLLDNQVHETRAGYHVITPLKLQNRAEYVLINRGWIPANATHSDTPAFDTPTGTQTVVGRVWIPGKRYFTLEPKSNENTTFKSVWQYMDVAQIQQTLPIKISPLLVKLSPQSNAGGFERAWTVSFKRIATHMSYAYQWFGFAAATLLIFIYMNTEVKKVEC